MSKELIDECRNMFEKDAEPYGYSVRRATCHCCMYHDQDTENRWNGWQAAWEYLDTTLDIDGHKL